MHPIMAPQCAASVPLAVFNPLLVTGPPGCPDPCPLPAGFRISTSPYFPLIPLIPLIPQKNAHTFRDKLQPTSTTAKDSQSSSNMLAQAPEFFNFLEILGCTRCTHCAIPLMNHELHHCLCVAVRQSFRLQGTAMRITLF